MRRGSLKSDVALQLKLLEMSNNELTYEEQDCALFAAAVLIKLYRDDQVGCDC